MKRSAFTVFILLPLLLLSCAALWQSDSGRAIQAARGGEYAEGIRTLEPLVAGGNNDPAAVDALYNAWIRQGEYTKAKERFDAWAAARPNSAPIRYAAGRVNRIMGNYDVALTNLNAVLNSPDFGVAVNFEVSQQLVERQLR